MSLLQTILDGVGIAFEAMGDIPKTATVKSDPIGTYDGQTDTTAIVWGSERSVQLIGWDEARRGDANNPTVVEKFAIFQAKEVDTPPKDTSLVIIDSVTYKVRSVETDPAGATFICALYQ